MSETRLPTTLVEAVRYFSDEDVCIDFVARLRWTDGVAVCPRCGSRDHAWLATRRVWKCRACKKQFSVKVGTIFEDSPIKLKNWLCSIWLIANSKNGISSHELGRAVGLTQKSAWFVLHRIRLAMQTGSFDKLDGTVEVDESFVGGKAINMHESKRKAKGIRGGGTAGKTVVLGALQRNGEVRAAVVADRKSDTLVPLVSRHVAKNSTVYTDAHQPYRSLPVHGFEHDYVDHGWEYVRDRVHTNGIENFWNASKRCSVESLAGV